VNTSPPTLTNQQQTMPNYHEEATVSRLVYPTPAVSHAAGPAARLLTHLGQIGRNFLHLTSHLAGDVDDS
jgi:hypothetical protein